MSTAERQDSRLVHLTRRLFSLPAREFGELLVAQAYLLGALWAVLTRPKGALLHPVAEPATAGAESDAGRLPRLALAVNRAASYGLFRPTCLVRAVALEKMIQRSGAGAAVVRVGVRMHGERLLAHAWIEQDGRVVGDEPARVSLFTPLHDFTALAR